MTRKSESRSELETDNKPTDGGYGWVVVGSVFVIAFLSFGAVYSIGLLFHRLMAEFECSSSAVAAVATINFSVQCFIGPLVNMIHDQFGTRVVGIVGCLIISFSFIFSAFAPSIVFLYVVFGLFGGLGVALAFQPVFVIISFYFDKYLAVATAISGVGWFIGRFVHPHLLRYLLLTYDWRGTFLITGGLTLNSVPACLLLHPRSPLDTKQKNSKSSSSSDVESQQIPLSSRPESIETSSHRASDVMVETPTLKTPDDEARRFAKGSEESDAQQRSILSDEESAMILANLIEENLSGQKTNCVAFSGDEVGSTVGTACNSGATTPRKFTYTRRRAPSRPNKYTNLKRTTSTSEVRRIARHQQHVARRRLKRTWSDPCDGEKEAAKTVRQKLEGQRFSSFLSLFTHRILHLSKRSLAKPLADQSKRKSVANSMEPVMEQLEHLPEISISSVVASETHPQTTKFIKPLKETLENPEVDAFIVANFLIWLVFYLPALFIDDWGSEIGWSADDTTWLLSLVGLGNAVGRPIVAFFGDRFHHKRIFIFVLMVSVCGVLTAATPHFVSEHDYGFVAVFVFIFSTLNGGAQLMILPVLGDMIPMEKVGFTFSVLIAVEGVAVLIGAPLLAIFNSYAVTFSVAGYILIASSVILAVVSYATQFIKWWKRTTT